MRICFALDAGARGIVAPMVNTRAEAEAMVRACRYYPPGNRSNAGVRGEWGEFKNYRDYMDAVNNELVIVPMIETNQSLENLDAIASVPGVDVLLIGPSDLSIELGVPLDYQCDIYQRALDKIAATAAKHGIAAGMYFIPPGMDPNFFVRKGCSSPCREAPGRRPDPKGPGRDRALTRRPGRSGERPNARRGPLTDVPHPAVGPCQLVRCHTPLLADWTCSGLRAGEQCLGVCDRPVDGEI